MKGCSVSHDEENFTRTFQQILIALLPSDKLSSQTPSDLSMPVVTEPAGHPAESIRNFLPVVSEEDLLKGSCSKDFQNCESIIQSSFSHLRSGPATISSSNGFVYAAVRAYNNHHHLVIRPEASGSPF